MKKNILITGATGFIGSHLARRMASEDYTVHLIVRESSDVSGTLSNNPNFVLHYYDGTQASLNKVIEVSQPLIVYHLASLFLSQHKSEDIKQLIESNVLFGTQLLEAMISNGIDKLVNTGTSWQHYQNDSFNPVNLYAATKEAFENILKFYTETTNLQVITLKLFDTYGPKDTRKKLFSLLKEIAESGSELQMSPGEQLVDIVYIDDVVEAFLIAGSMLESSDQIGNKEYAISSGEPLSLRSIAGIFSTTVGKKLEIVWGGREYRNREVMIPWNNGERLPNWNPKVSLEKGIISIMHEDDEVI